ncbi:helix-turn-helix domain-containing protein [Bacillus sp. FSL K6-3431]|uniref:helix-turn-helix domain-containing protein n=1 Tax=Bacillus sp. FSL K6-3431 TaxID=2921500 RepID=UPI0040469203
MQYVNRMRIDKAKMLLTSTGMSVTKISSEVGIESHYFSRLFKQQEGFSPSEFRKRKL